MWVLENKPHLNYKDCNKPSKDRFATVEWEAGRELFLCCSFDPGIKRKQALVVFTVEEAKQAWLEWHLFHLKLSAQNTTAHWSQARAVVSGVVWGFFFGCQADSKGKLRNDNWTIENSTMLLLIIKKESRFPDTS